MLSGAGARMAGELVELLWPGVGTFRSLDSATDDIACIS